MEHNKYWAERFEQLNESELRKADDLSAEMVKEYRQTAQDLNDDIQRWYARFAAENQMSLAEARRVLTGRELAEFRWTVDEYIKYAKKADLSEAYIQKLKNASARVHIDRLEAIQMQMAQRIERLATKGNARLTDVLRDIYPDAHLRTAYEVQKKAGFDSFSRIPETDVERILKKPWVSDGLNFSDRIWRDKERLLSTLQGELTRGLIRGEPYGKVAQRIAGRMNVAMSAASRLVETEAAFFSSKGQLDAFRDLGVEQYEFVATLDSRTSEICREMDGKVLPLDECKPGITAPPLHCRCRSTICPYFDDEFTEGETRASRDPKTGKTEQVESKLTYGDWKDVFVDKKLTLEDWRSKNSDSQTTNAAEPLNTAPQSDKIKTEESSLYPDTLAGVARGEPMDFDKANHMRANPLYRIEPGNDINCQSCVVAYEARIRGYNVMAKANHNNPVAMQVARKTNLAWLDATTRQNLPYITDTNKVYTAKTYLKWLHEHLEEGARYTLEFGWKGRSRMGHIISAKIENGKIIFYDPQIGQLYVEGDVKTAQRKRQRYNGALGRYEEITEEVQTADPILAYLGRLKYSLKLMGTTISTTPRLMRVDNAIIDPVIVEDILKEAMQDEST